MNSPGIFNSGDFVITAADTVVSDWIDGFDGILSLSFQAKFAYGSGGTSGKIFLQTSLDQETTPIDIVCITFTTSSLTKVINLSALTPKTTAISPSDGSLADDTCVDGILGDRFRVKVITVGTYAGSTSLSTRICAR